MVGNDPLEVGLVAGFCGVEQTEPGGATLHEEREDFGVFELARKHVRGLGPTKAEDVNAAA